MATPIRRKIAVSFEFFPTNTQVGADKLDDCARKLDELDPQFFSVTYGAGGSTRERTHAIVTRIQNELSTTAMAHQTCVGDSPQAISRNVERLVAAGVTPEGLDRLRSPIGLDLGGRTPEETAISIVAEIIALRTGRDVGALRDGAGPIHR